VNHALGYLPDTPDTRDYLWRSPLRVRPSSASLVPQVTSVLNQGRLGSCVANAGFQAIRMAQRRQGHVLGLMGSRLFAYWLCRAAEHTTKFDAGTRLRTFFDTVNTFGFPPEELWPYSDRDDGDLRAPFRVRPPTRAFIGAYDLRSPTLYERIPAGTAAPALIADALSQGLPVAFGADVSQTFASDRFDPAQPVKPPRVSEVAGGHAMVFAGYETEDGAATPTRFRVLNSWGEGWGEAGYCWFTREYVEQARDIWVVRQAPIPGER
jgi:C1A family cysteine protease